MAVVMVDNHQPRVYVSWMNEATLCRFWSKVNKTDTCWLWAASKRNKGYGAFVWADVDGNIIQGQAHRFAWEMENGPIPAGLCVLHRCDTPACVRVDHLFLGTKAENNADMSAKGRHVAGGTWCGAGRYRRGEDHHNVKLSDDDCRKMREDRRDGMPFSALGIKYDVNTSTAWKICSGHRRTVKEVESAN